MIEHFETTGTRAFYRPQGSIPAGRLVEKITLALQLGRRLGTRDMLVDISGATGFASPGPGFRRWAVQRWARECEQQVRLAMVAREELICPQKTGLLVAAEEGLRAHICTSEAEAGQWLDGLNAEEAEAKEQSAARLKNGS